MPEKIIKRGFFYFSLLFILAVITVNAQSGRVQPTPPPQTIDDDPVNIRTEEIKVNFLAFDDNGKFVPDVAADDLVVSDNDILHNPASVRRIPANVLLVLDTGGELRSVKTLNQTIRTALALLNALQPGDAVAAIQYSDQADVILEWTTDREIATAAIRKAKFGKRSAFAEAVRLGKDILAKTPTDNRHMVLISDGTDSIGGSEAKKTAFREILGTDISVHVISYTRLEIIDITPRTKGMTTSPPRPALPPEVAAQLPEGPRIIAQSPKIGPTINLDRALLNKLRKRKADLEESEKELTSLAEDTNGTIIIPDSIDEMEEHSASVAKLIDSSYVLTYVPKIPVLEKGGERLIRVTSRKPGLIIEARRKLVVHDAQ